MCAFSRVHVPTKLRDTCDNITDVILLTIYFKSYIVYLILKAISNEKVVNCKVVDLIEYYNLNANFVSIQHC